MSTTSQTTNTYTIATEQDTVEPSVLHLSSQDQQQWKSVVESQLNSMLVQASELQNLLTGSKTSTKKAFYTKKITKLNKHVLQYVGALQQLQHINSPEGSVDDTNITG
jgi:hypothetical protein